MMRSWTQKLAGVKPRQLRFEKRQQARRVITKLLIKKANLKISNAVLEIYEHE
jgi:hypothetical protein